MPNHTANLLTVTGPNARAILKQYVVKGDEGYFLDLDKILPKPEIYAQFGGLISSFRSFSPEEEKRLVAQGDEGQLKEFRLQRELYEKGMPSTPLDWSIKNWGTKWNSYGGTKITGSATKAHTSFDTAWSPPLPCVAKLSELHPDHTFIIKYADEGAAFLGHSTFVNGEHQEVEEDWSSTKGIKLRQELGRVSDEEIDEIENKKAEAKALKKLKKAKDSQLKLAKSKKSMSSDLELI